MAKQVILQINGLRVEFGGLRAVNDVSLEICSEEILSIIGPNGAGKTTLFNALTGLADISQGTIKFCGRDLAEQISISLALRWVLTGLFTALLGVIALNLNSLWRVMIVDLYKYREPFSWIKAYSGGIDYLAALGVTELTLTLVFAFTLGLVGAATVWWRGRHAPEKISRKGIVRTFQNIRLFSQLSAEENVLVALDRFYRYRFWSQLLGLPRSKDEELLLKESALDALQFVGLDSVRNTKAANLSYGDQRRLEIARAIATKPQLILLDEPGAGMNPSETGKLMELIRGIRDRGISVVLIEHHMKVVMGISDRVAVFDRGEKIADGGVEEVRGDIRVIEAYLGESEV